MVIYTDEQHFPDTLLIRMRIALNFALFAGHMKPQAQSARDVAEPDSAPARASTTGTH